MATGPFSMPKENRRRSGLTILASKHDFDVADEVDDRGDAGKARDTESARRISGAARAAVSNADDDLLDEPHHSGVRLIIAFSGCVG